MEFIFKRKGIKWERNQGELTLKSRRASLGNQFSENERKSALPHRQTTNTVCVHKRKENGKTRAGMMTEKSARQDGMCA